METDSKILPAHISRQVGEMLSSQESITYFKHHYIRRTGLNRKIKKLILETLREAEQIEILDDWLIKGRYSDGK